MSKSYTSISLNEATTTMLGKAILIAILSCGLYQAPIVTLAASLTLVITYGAYALWVFQKWNKDFSGHRTTRRHEASPSNRTMPKVKTLEENKELILNNSKYHAQFDDCELLNDVKDMETTRELNTVFRERAKRVATLTPSNARKMLGELTGAMLGSLNMVEEADELDMDHM